MSSIREQNVGVRWLRSGLAIAILAAMLAAGCQSRRAPFEDLARQEVELEDDALAAAPAPATFVAAEEEPPPTPPAELADGAGRAARHGEEPAPPATIDVMETPMPAAPETRASAIMMDEVGGARRLWPLAVAIRPSGDVIAGASYYPDVRPRRDRPVWVEPVIETGEFLLHTLLLPINVVRTPPWKAIVYSEVDDAMTVSLEPEIIGPPGVERRARPEPEMDERPVDAEIDVEPQP